MHSHATKTKPPHDHWSVLHLINAFDARYDRDQRRIVCLQRRRGYDVTVVTSRYDDDLKRRNAFFFQQAEEDLSGVKIFHNYSCKLRFSTEQQMVFYLPNLASLRAFDITHVHGLTSYACVLGCLFKRLNQSKLVIRSDLSQAGYEILKNNAVYKSFFFKLLKSMDAVYAYTASEKAILLDVGIPEDYIWVVPIGIELDRFRKRTATDDSDSAVTIGYIGRFDRVKGVHRLVKPLSQVLRECENVRVMFAGPKQDVQYATPILRELSLFPRFSYAGRLSADEVPGFYHGCDIIVIPSLFDTGAIVALEAMASGKAIVASNIRPFNEYLEDGVSGLLVDTEGEIYSSCKQLIKDSDLRARLGRAALQQASNYSDVTMIRKLEEIYTYVTQGGELSAND